MPFNLRARIVRSFQDVQQNFEQLAGMSSRGTVRLSWPGGSQVSNSATVTHGIGRVPELQLTVVGNSGLALTPIADVTARDERQFTVRATTVDGTTPAGTATTDVSWRAEG